MKKMKLNLILAAVLMSAGVSKAAEPVAFYAGVSVGHTINGDAGADVSLAGLAASAGGGKGSFSSATLELGGGFAAMVGANENGVLLAGMSAKVLGIHNQTLLMPSLDLFATTEGVPMSLKLSLSGSTKTGIAPGFSVQTSLNRFCKSCKESTALKVGYTNFHRKLDGVSGVVSVGFDSVF